MNILQHATHQQKISNDQKNLHLLPATKNKAKYFGMLQVEVKTEVKGENPEEQDSGGVERAKLSGQRQGVEERIDHRPLLLRHISLKRPETMECLNSPLKKLGANPG